MAASGKLMDSFRNGKFDLHITKFIKFCNIVLIISTIMCILSIFITPLAFNVNYEEYPVVVHFIIFIFLGSFYICAYGALPATILALMLYYIHKKHRTEKLDIAFTQKITIRLIIVIIVLIATAVIMLGIKSH